MPFPRSGRARQSLSAAAMSALLLVSAMKHFRDPGFYRQVVPDYLCLIDPQQQGTGHVGADAGIAPASGTAAFDGGHKSSAGRPFAVMTRDEWIAVSGLLELAAAVGILVPVTRKAAATALTAMFTGFLAGHADALRRAYGPQGTPMQRKVHTLRFPLQAPLILWAWSLRSPGSSPWR
jgi:uncharacterized membrane protein